MPDDGGIAVTESLQQTDLPALEKNDAAECQMNQKEGDTEKNRRQGQAHAAQHVQAMIEEGV